MNIAVSWRTSTCTYLSHRQKSFHSAVYRLHGANKNDNNRDLCVACVRHATTRPEKIILFNMLSMSRHVPFKLNSPGWRVQCFHPCCNLRSIKRPAVVFWLDVRVCVELKNSACRVADSAQKVIVIYLFALIFYGKLFNLVVLRYCDGYSQSHSRTLRHSSWLSHRSQARVWKMGSLLNGLIANIAWRWHYTCARSPHNVSNGMHTL